MQEYLPQDHLSAGRPTASRACPHDPDRLVTKRRRVVARAQRPVQGGGQDAGDGVVVLRCGYEHGVIGAYLLPKLFDGFGIALILEVLVEVRHPGEVEALATHPLRSHLARRSHDAPVEGGSPEAGGEAEYAEITIFHCLSPRKRSRSQPPPTGIPLPQQCSPRLEEAHPLECYSPTLTRVCRRT